MKKLNFFKYIIYVSLVFVMNIYAQNNAIWIEDGFGQMNSSGNQVDIVLANEDSLGGFQFELNYDTSLVRYEDLYLLNHFDELDLFTNELIPGSVTIIVASLDGEIIEPMAGSILTAEFQIKESEDQRVADLTISGLALSDIYGNTVPGVQANGYIFSEGISALRAENGIGNVQLTLYNGFAASGVQFTVSYDSDLISLQDVMTTDRSNAMTMLYNETEPGKVTVLIYSATQMIIDEGSGPIINMYFDDLGDQFSTLEIELLDVAISNDQGMTMETTNLGGTYFMLGDNDFSWSDYHNLRFIIDVNHITNGDSSFWLENEIQMSIGDCQQNFGDQWYSMDDLFLDSVEFNFFTDCEAGTEVSFQLRMLPEDAWPNLGYEYNISSFEDFGIDTTIYHYLNINVLSDQIIGITEASGLPGDTISLSVYAELEESYDMNSFQVSVVGLGGGNISAIGVDTAGTIMTSDWLWSYFITDSGNVVITAGAGAESVSATGTLFNVQFVINEDSEEGFFSCFSN